MIITVDALLEKPLVDEVIAFQTDTVYGVGCRIDSRKGVERIYELKGRDDRKPLPVLCADIEDARSLVQDPSQLEPYAARHWPGALTLVVKKSEVVGPHVTRGEDTIGVRVPDDDLARRILRHFGPMAVTSLNRSQEPSCRTFEQAKAFADRVDYLVEGGTAKGVSSTVFDVASKRVLRPGEVDPEG